MTNPDFATIWISCFWEDRLYRLENTVVHVQQNFGRTVVKMGHNNIGIGSYDKSRFRHHLDLVLLGRPTVSIGKHSCSRSREAVVKTGHNNIGIGSYGKSRFCHHLDLELPRRPTVSIGNHWFPSSARSQHVQADMQLSRYIYSSMALARPNDSCRIPSKVFVSGLNCTALSKISFCISSSTDMRSGWRR